jgi:hypothetical protein
MLGRMLLWASAVSLWTAPAVALPQTFDFVSGSAHITANVVGQTSLLVDTVAALNGTFFQFDPSPVSVPDFKISLAPTGPIAMNGRYGGYDMFTINSALLVPGTGFSSSGVAVGGSKYSVSMGPLNVNAVYSATDSTGFTPPASNVTLPPFTNPSLNATVDANLITLELFGVTLGIFPGAFVGEASNLIVKGDITFVGKLNTATVPEPTTASLLGLGLLGLALRRRDFARWSGIEA